MPLQPCGAYKSVPCEQEMSRFVWGCRGSLGPELQPELQTPASSCRADMQEADGRGFLLLVFLLLGGLLSERSLSFCYHGLSISLRKGGNGDPI